MLHKSSHNSMPKLSLPLLKMMRDCNGHSITVPLVVSKAIIAPSGNSSPETNHLAS